MQLIYQRFYKQNIIVENGEHHAKGQRLFG